MAVMTLKLLLELVLVLLHRSPRHGIAITGAGFDVVVLPEWRARMSGPVLKDGKEDVGATMTRAMMGSSLIR